MGTPLPAFMTGLDLVEDGYASEHYEYAYNIADPASRRVLEEILPSATWPLHSPFVREHYGRGKTYGLAEGRVEAEADAILSVLEARGISVTDDARGRIRGCTEKRRLDLWLRRAATATSLTDLFE